MCPISEFALLDGLCPPPLWFLLLLWFSGQSGLFLIGGSLPNLRAGVLAACRVSGLRGSPKQELGPGYGDEGG